MNASSAPTRSDANILWMESLKSLFPISDEFDLACAIYSFEGARDDGMTPQEAYEDFDRFVAQDD